MVFSSTPMSVATWPSPPPSPPPPVPPVVSGARVLQAAVVRVASASRLAETRRRVLRRGEFLLVSGGTGVGVERVWSCQVRLAWAGASEPVGGVPVGSVSAASRPGSPMEPEPGRRKRPAIRRPIAASPPGSNSTNATIAAP